MEILTGNGRNSPAYALSGSQGSDGEEGQAEAGESTEPVRIKSRKDGEA